MQLALPNAPGCPEAGAVNRCRCHLAAVLWCRRSPRHQLPEVLGCKQGRSSRCRGQAQGQGSLVAAGRHGQRCWGLVLNLKGDQISVKPAGTPQEPARLPCRAMAAS